METGMLNPFRGSSRFWALVPHGTQTHLELPSDYAQLWHQTRQTTDDCVYITSADGQISQLGITRWNGSIFITDGLPEFICSYGLSPNDVLVFSFTTYTDLRVAFLKAGGAEFPVNQGFPTTMPAQQDNIPTTGRTTFLPSGIPTYHGQAPPTPPIRIERSCRIIVDQVATRVPFILEIPHSFAMGNLTAGAKQIRLNFDGDMRFKILCILGPTRAIATSGWKEFAEFAELRSGEKVHIHNPQNNTDTWNITVTPADE